MLCLVICWEIKLTTLVYKNTQSINKQYLSHSAAVHRPPQSAVLDYQTRRNRIYSLMGKIRKTQRTKTWNYQLMAVFSFEWVTPIQTLLMFYIPRVESLRKARSFLVSIANDVGSPMALPWLVIPPTHSPSIGPTDDFPLWRQKSSL